MTFRRYSTFAVLFAVAGCASTSSNDAEPRTAADMKAKLDAATPVGTAAGVSASRLRSLGFAVSQQTDADWAGRGSSTYLDAVRNDDGFPIRARWRAALFDVAGVVTGSDVKQDLTGL